MTLRIIAAAVKRPAPVRTPQDQFAAAVGLGTFNTTGDRFRILACRIIRTTQKLTLTTPLDAIATDHAPHASHEKECPLDQVSFGIIGLETSLALTITELVDKKVITLSRAIELLSVNPRKIRNNAVLHGTDGHDTARRAA